MRSHGRLRADPGGSVHGQTRGRRFALLFSVQHVSKQGPAARADRQSGRSRSRAALDPPPTDDLYFVANTEGGHFFSKTLKEHNRNVARYRRLLEGSQNPSAGVAP